MRFMQKIKTFLSMYTNKPIYLGKGVSCNDTLSLKVEANTYKLRKDTGPYKIANVVRKGEGVSYVVRDDSNGEQFIITKTLFNKIFKRVKVEGND